MLLSFCCALPTVLVPAVAPAGAARPPRPLAAPLEELSALVESIEAARRAVPEFDPRRRGDRAYVEEYGARLAQAVGRLAELILQLYERAPEHPRVPELMGERWSALASQLGRAGAVLEEIEAVAAEHPGTPLARESRFWRANIVVNHREGPAKYLYEFDEARELAVAFSREDEADPERRAWLLRSLADRRDAGDGAKLRLYRRLVGEFPRTRNAAGVGGKLRQLEGLGEPFELAFRDAISGREVSIESLRGKVVVVDFWATWCRPCVADVPRMKALYERFHEEGVEFVGVSLDLPEDQGGLARLKQFVAANEIPWPQYYQGGGWDSEFSSSWGISSIPALFVVDAEGRLVSVDGRGKLERLLPELLAARGRSE